ncbi:MAG TPA: ATP-binding protein, partial [Micromonosporaceae bacterium]|nr:ATP-binding protein [Micromonosporaceae bacterium]
MSVAERTRRAAEDESDRLRAVGEYLAVGAAVPPDLQAIVRLAAYVCGVPHAAVNLIDAELQHRIAAHGIEPAVCAREDSMCAVSIAQARPVMVPDARLDPRFAANPWVTGALGRIRFYAAAQLRGADGHVLGTLCVFDDTPHELDPAQWAGLEALARMVVDVLELRRRDRMLRDALAAMARAGEELTRSNTALQHFAAQVSHDLLNPLTGVVGFISELADLPAVSGDPEAAHAAERALGSANRMWRMIDDVLRHAAVGGEPNLRPVDLAEVANQVREDLSTSIEASNATVTVDPLPTVVGDATQLRVLLQNLLSNALKFRRADRPARVRIAGDTLTDRWRLRVIDNGIGIPADQRAEVRELFARLHPEVEGSGVGLTTCQRIAAAHHGELIIDGTPGGGTTVTLTLPRVAHPPVAHPPVAHPPVAHPPVAHPPVDHEVSGAFRRNRHRQPHDQPG